MSDDSDDDGTFSIRLVDEEGNPHSFRTVTVRYPWGGGHEDRDTDDDGWCEFPTFGRSYTGAIYSYRLHGILVLQQELLLSESEEICDGATFSFTIIDE